MAYLGASARRPGLRSVCRHRCRADLRWPTETRLHGWGGRTRTQKCRGKISLGKVAQISGDPAEFRPQKYSRSSCDGGRRSSGLVPGSRQDACAADADMIRRRPIQQYHYSLCAGLLHASRPVAPRIAFCGREGPAGSISPHRVSLQKLPSFVFGSTCTFVPLSDIANTLGGPAGARVTGDT